MVAVIIGSNFLWISYRLDSTITMCMITASDEIWLKWPIVRSFNMVTHQCPVKFKIAGLLSEVIMSLCSSMVMVCEQHNIEMPIFGVKDTMNAMSNPSLLSTFW